RADGHARVADRLVELEIADLRARRVHGLLGRRGRRAGWRSGDLGRLIAEHARHAPQAFAAPRVLGRLLAAHELDVRIEALARLLGLREIDLGRDARANTLETDDRPDEALNPSRVFV